MMINNLIDQLETLNIKLFLDRGELCIDAPKNTLDNQLITKIKSHKLKIIDYLKNRDDSTVLNTLTKEAVLDSDIFPKKPFNIVTNISSILLTGATGFFGSFLLKELLEATTAHIYCLVRAENINLATQKLQASLKSYLLLDAIDFRRITLITGDLAKPNLGLSSSIYQDLASKIDVIYHNGAFVHHGLPYESLKETNVGGTQAILRLACDTKVKPVHFISTVSVFNIKNVAETTIIKEADSIEKYAAPLSGYSQSKWVAEKLVTIAKERGLPVSIYRLGPVFGSSKTGAFNSNDFLYRLMIGYVHLGSAPEGEILLDILPVDYATCAIAYLAQKPESLGKAFHFIHHQPVSSNLLFERLNKAGYSITRVPYKIWYSQLIDIAQNHKNHILYPLVSLFAAKKSGEGQKKSFNLKFDCQNTLKGLAQSSITCPAIDEKLFDVYISFLRDRGLLNN